MENLKPCPFCGDNEDLEVVVSSVPNKFEVLCNTCFCAGPACKMKDNAISMWNRRYNINNGSEV